MTAPTVAQVKRYLLHNDWHEEHHHDGVTIWRSPAGKHQVMLNAPDDDTLLGQGMVLHAIACAAGRTVEQAAVDVFVDPEDFLGCTRRCWPRSKPPAEWTHTLRWGDCDKAEKPPVKPATVDIPIVRTGEDGYLLATSASVSVALFALWVEHLPPEDQHVMLQEIAVVEPWHRADVVAQWRRTAEQLADPLRREVLLGENVPSDFVEAPRPGGVE